MTVGRRSRDDVTTLGRDAQPLAPKTGLDARAPSPVALALDPKRYVVSDVLGEGGMGEVWRCRDQAAAREVALKAMRPDADVDDVKQRFLIEARVQARLAHPAVVPVYDVGSDLNGRAYFT